MKAMNRSRARSGNFSRSRRTVRRRVTRRSKKPVAKFKRIAVLMGGVSRERSVSMKSGMAVVKALTEAGKIALPVIINHDDERALRGIPDDYDVAFIALHGRFGEDGMIQSLLAARDMAFTGAGPAASALAYDKIKAKERMHAAGIPTPTSVSLYFPWTTVRVRQALEKIEKYPVVVKPSCEGSSIGVAVAHSPREAREMISKARKYADNLVIEEFIPGREITVPIFRGLHLPIIETVMKQDFFTFYAKYEDPQTEYQIAPYLAPDTQGWIFKVARAAHKVLGCEPFSRVDVRLDPEGRPWVLEVNTIPGLTATSLLPKAAAHRGLSFADLCVLMVENAAVRNSSMLKSNERVLA
jgi:D-alanine-D-alanine ligase